MKDLSEEDVFGKVERAILRYLCKDEDTDRRRTRYDIILVDKFEAPDAAGKVLFIAALRTRFTPLGQSEETMLLGSLLVTLQEDKSLKISSPILSAHLASL
jgi:hypothetical protein